MLLFCKELFEYIDGHDIERVIIDLRFNGGGNSMVLEPVILGLTLREKINRKGHLFVLIGPRTFSSAMMNAWQLKTRTAALLVGRPTGQKPNSFGEMRNFKLSDEQFSGHDVTIERVLEYKAE